MNCQVCGGTMESMTSDMPFKTGRHSIFIVKELPVVQCTKCGEFVIEDSVMAWVEESMKKTDPRAELEVIRYAA